MPAAAPPRRLRRLERAAAYACAGVVTEVLFTGIQGVLHRETRSGHLRAHTYLWMAPLYALLALGFEPAHDRLRGRPAVIRALAYACGIIAAEYGSGRLIERAVGVVPWDYRGRSRLQIDGATRLDYAPFWAAAGLLLERLDDALRAVRISVA
ncbi:MAG: putative ABC transporter permease [Candidatus Dormibacteria bacterium]